MSAPRSRREANPFQGVEPEAEIEIEAEPPPRSRSSKINVPKQTRVTKVVQEIHEERGDAVEVLFPPRPDFGDEESYQDIYCDLVVAYLSQGYTLSAFAGAAGVSREIIVYWGQRNPRFVEAVKVARLACQRWWEAQLLEVATKGTHTSGRVTAIQFALKNLAKDDWTDTQRLEVSGRDGSPLGAVRFDAKLLNVTELAQLEHLIDKATPPDRPR